MNGGVCRKPAAIHKSRSISPGSPSVSGSDSEEDGEQDFSVEILDNRTVDEALSLVDEFNTRKYSIREECYVAEDYYQDSGKEDEGEAEIDSKNVRQLRKLKVLHYIPPLLSTKVNNSSVINIVPPGGDERKSSSKRKKKKKRRKTLSICTVNCKYEVVRRIASRFGMRDVAEDESWNLFWTDLSISVERAKEMKRFQKINHFPGMSEICRKDLLARNLNRMLKIFPKEYNFFPKTWCLPADLGDVVSYARTKRNRTYICKPETGCQGRGIFLTKTLKDIKPYDRMICQVYLAKPFLVDGYKFDLRIYTLITSCDPLRIYLYNDGLSRFATSRYREPTHTNTTNVFMHLTNYAVNKHSRTFVVDDEAGSKRKISTLNKWLQKKDYNVTELWSHIDDVIIKTIIAAYPMLKHSYHACFPAHDFTYACFELLGFDILLDYRLKPYILEVNHSPSFHTDAQIDREIKEGLLMDTFEILNLSQTDKRKVMEEDRRRVRERLLQGITHKESGNSDIQNSNVPGKVVQDSFKAQVLWEEKHMGNFRCIYPGKNSERYDKFFNQNQSSLFQDTAASRAREECARMQRIELESKAKIEASKRPGMKVKDVERLRPESPVSKDGNKLKALPMVKKKLPLSFKNSQPEIKTCTLYSFEPDPIVEMEERERVTGLAQRDFLIRSYGVLEQIYIAMQKNGSLRPEDEKKYGLYGKLGYMHEIGPILSNKLPAMPTVLSTHVTKSSPLIKFSRNNCVEAQQHCMLTVNEEYDTGAGDKFQPFCDGIQARAHTGLTVTCNNVPILSRPHIPRAVWVDDSKERDVRITKAHVARTFTNSVKLQELQRREQRHFHDES